MSSPISIKKNIKSFLIIIGAATALFFLLLYFIFTSDQGKRKAVPDRYSEAKFNQLNALIAKQQADSSADRKKIIAESEKALSGKRAALQKKIFDQEVANKIQKVAPVPQLNINSSSNKNTSRPINANIIKPKPIVVTPPPVIPKVIIPQPRTTVS